MAEGRRGVMWKLAARTLFPGLSVNALRADPPEGSIHGSGFGPGDLWRILSPPLRVDYAPGSGTERSPEVFSLMLQLEGATVVSQKKRECVLAKNDLCVLDGVTPFQLEVTEQSSQIVFLRMPRHLALGRYPSLERRTAQRFESAEPGAMALRALLLSLLECADFLKPEQCTTALVAAACLIGAPKPAALTRGSDMNWRARAALEHIENHLADPALSAERIAAAQGICRRRLDELMLQTVGSSLAARIWTTRLNRAAEELRHPSRASATVTSIAFSLGFVDAAHFARAFKRRFGCSPREWRSSN